jgi:glycosyltransferase involved in cell wall biosynthesis
MEEVIEGPVTETGSQGPEISFKTNSAAQKAEGARMSSTLAAIAAYNEEVAIGSVVLRCLRYADEVLVVDDGSEDRTAEIAKIAGASVLRHEVNAGKGVAIQTALEYARVNGFDAMVLLDGDGQHDPGEIPQLLAPVLDDKADLTIGVRKRSTSRMPIHRRFGQRVLDFMTAAGSLDALTDSQSGFRALSRAAISSLRLEERSFSIESEMLIDAKEKHLRVAEVPIRARYDVEGSTKGPLSHGFGVVDRLLRIIAVRHPLLFFGVFGGAVFIVGILMGIVALETYKRAPELAIGYSFLVVVFLIFGSLAMFAGVMLNVLPRAVARTLGNQGK